MRITVMEPILYFGGQAHRTGTPQSSEHYQNWPLGYLTHWTQQTQFDSNQLMDLWEYVNKVWVNENNVPQEEDALAAISRETLQQAFEEFAARGGEVRRGGTTLEEAYLGLQLILHTPLVCLINNQQIPQPTTRMRQTALLDPHALLTYLVQALEAKTFDRALHRSLVGIDPFLGYVGDQWGSMFQTMTYDGEIAHTILILGIDPRTHNIVYYDPWRGHSLLSRTQNNAGIAAIPYISRKRERLWMITPGELEQIVYAVMMPVRQWDQMLKGSDNGKIAVPAHRSPAQVSARAVNPLERYRTQPTPAAVNPSAAH